VADAERPAAAHVRERAVAGAVVGSTRSTRRKKATARRRKPAAVCLLAVEDLDVGEPGGVVGAPRLDGQRVVEGVEPVGL